MTKIILLPIGVLVVIVIGFVLWTNQGFLGSEDGDSKNLTAKIDINEIEEDEEEYPPSEGFVRPASVPDPEPPKVYSSEEMFTLGCAGEVPFSDLNGVGFLEVKEIQLAEEILQACKEHFYQDFNADGYKDLRLITGTYVKNVDSSFWLYNSEKESFVYAGTIVSDDIRVQPDGSLSVVSHYAGPAEWTASVYQWEEGKLIQVSSENYIVGPDSEDL
jgi:hypothetical protein